MIKNRDDLLSLEKIYSKKDRFKVVRSVEDDVNSTGAAIHYFLLKKVENYREYSSCGQYLVARPCLFDIKSYLPKEVSYKNITTSIQSLIDKNYLVIDGGVPASSLDLRHAGVVKRRKEPIILFLKIKKLIHKRKEVTECDGIDKNKKYRYKENCIYAIKTPIGIKIGLTSRLGNRLADYQSEFGCACYPIDLLTNLSRKDARAMEYSLHKYFLDKNISGEYFNLLDSEVKSTFSKVREINTSIMDNYRIPR